MQVRGVENVAKLKMEDEKHRDSIILALCPSSGQKSLSQICDYNTMFLK